MDLHARCSLHNHHESIMFADTLTLIIATDRGLGPEPLTLHRPKAALPFGGKFRVIDFTLANCLHSGLHQVLVLTQYKSHSLHKHLRDGWSIFNSELGEFITMQSIATSLGRDETMICSTS